MAGARTAGRQCVPRDCPRRRCQRAAEARAGGQACCCIGCDQYDFGSRSGDSVDKPAALVAETAPADQSAASKPDPTQAAATTSSQDSAACQLNKSFDILGFNENSNDLTPSVFKALDGVAKAIGAQQCKVRITGYSSTEGSYANNALFSLERAQNSLHYLTRKGTKFARYSAAGVGETTQFGATPRLNRRVVITVTP